MKAADVRRAHALLTERARHLDRLRAVCSGGLTLNISSTYQEAPFVDAIRPHVIALIRNQIAHLDQDLRRLDVEPDAIPEGLEPNWALALLPGPPSQPANVPEEGLL